MFSSGAFPGSYELKALRNLRQGTWARIVRWWLLFSAVCLCWRNGRLTVHKDCVFPIIPNRGPSEQPPCFPGTLPEECMVNLLPLGDIFFSALNCEASFSVLPPYLLIITWRYPNLLLPSATHLVTSHVSSVCQVVRVLPFRVQPFQIATSRSPQPSRLPQPARVLDSMMLPSRVLFSKACPPGTVASNLASLQN